MKSGLKYWILIFTIGVVLATGPLLMNFAYAEEKISIPIPAKAEGPNPSSCTALDAIYVPNSDKPGEPALTYQLKIEENKDTSTAKNGARTAKEFLEKQIPIAFEQQQIGEKHGD